MAGKAPAIASGGVGGNGGRGRCGVICVPARIDWPTAPELVRFAGEEDARKLLVSPCGKCDACVRNRRGQDDGGERLSPLSFDFKEIFVDEGEIMPHPSPGFHATLIRPSPAYLKSLGASQMKNDISTITTDHMEIETDGTLLPVGAMAVFPFLEEDLVELVSRVPVEMAGNLARLAAWRAMGVACDWQGFPVIAGDSLVGV